MSCKDKQKFKTSEASSKASMRSKGAIDKFLNILDINMFNKLNKKWTIDAKERFNIDGNLFRNDDGKATPNKAAFKQIDAVKGITYPNKIDFNNLKGSKKNELAFDEDSEIKESNYSNENNKVLFNNQEGRITVDEVLENILNNYKNLSPIGRELLEKSRKLVGRTGAKIKFVYEESFEDETIVMQIESDTNNIQISKERLSKFTTDEVIESFLHELAHAQTLQALLNPVTFEEKQFAKLIKDYFNYYKNKNINNSEKLSELRKQIYQAELEFNDKLVEKLSKGLNSLMTYGFLNEKEFVAEIYANKVFKEELKALDKENNTSYWKRFLESLRRVFGLAKTKEADNLIEEIVNYVEADRRDYRGTNLQRTLFAKRIEDDSKYSSLESKLNNFIDKAKIKVQSIYDRTIKTNKKYSSTSKEELILRNKELLETLDKYEKNQKWKAVLGYAQSFDKTIIYVNNLLDKLITDKNIYEDKLDHLIKRYKDYLSAYDLLPEIKELLSQADLKQLELTEEELEDYKELKQFLSEASKKHDAIENKFLVISKAQVLQDFSNPIYNTEVETKQRIELIKEYNSLSDKGGLTVDQYISKMLSTRDLEDYSADLKASAEKILNDPSKDITMVSGKLEDPTNIKSKTIQIVNQILAESFDKVKTLVTTKVHKMSKIFDKFIAEKGNKKLSELNKNLIEKDKNGNVYLLNKYSIKFKDIYDNTFLPIINERKKYYESQIELGKEEKDIIVSKEYKNFNRQIANWFKEYTTKDSNNNTIPKSKYLNKELTGIEKEVLDGYIKINQENDNIEGFDSLITNIMGAEFHRLPSKSKSDLERALELDIKGLTKDKWTDLTKIKSDDIGIDSGSEERNTQGDIIRRVKTAYRGQIDPKEQSLDLETMFRNEYWNGQNFKEKTAIESKLLLVTDIAKSNTYYTGKSKIEVKGELSNTYKKLVGIMERNVYDIYSTYGGSFGPADINKITNALNGYAAGLAMTFNLASGVTNIANGLTQVFTEAVGGHRFNVKTFAKAETKYTKEMMNGNLLKDMSRSVKTSYFNQLLEMFDVFGGLGQNEQDALRNNIARKLGSKKTGNFLNESGEHAMHAILTESILDGIKAMDENNNYLDKDGNITREDKGASLADMLYFDENGQLQMNSKVAYSGFNLTTKYHEGGKSQINLLIKAKVFNLFGVYDIKYKNEISKAWWGKAVMMFKNFFLGAAAYRYTGFTTSYKKKSELTDDDRFYSSAEKEYIEGTYTTLVRFLRETGIPNLKMLQTMYMNYNNLTDYEKSNLRKATLEIMFTMVILPSIGLLLNAADGDDDDKLLWFAIYVNRRLTQELAQFRNPIEATRMIQNPVAGIRFIQNGLNFIYDVATPINFVPEKGESVFGYLDENSKGQNKMVKHLGKLVPIIPQIGIDYKQRYGLEFGK